VIAKPSKFGVEEVEVVFSHAERFAELFAKNKILFA
jgi:hypothetical protein